VIYLLHYATSFHIEVPHISLSIFYRKTISQMGWFDRWEV